MLKYLVLLFISILFVQIGYSQKEATWNKEQKNLVYAACDQELENNGISSSKEREDFCYCYLQKLTKNHSAFEVDNMIVPELNQIQNNYFNICSAETGVSLSTKNIATTVLEIFTGDWDRQKKDKYYSSCENDLRDNENNYTEDQIEEFCLCYIGKLSNQYTARELEEMISPELRRVKDKIYNKCISRTAVGTMTLEDNMLGRWESSTGEVLIFKENGSLKYIYEENDMDENWKWKCKPGNLLSFISDGVEIEYKVLHIKEDYIKYSPRKHSNQIYEYYKK